MATHSRILAWDIPWTEESGEQQSMENRKIQAGLSDWTTNTFLVPEGTEILITRNKEIRMKSLYKQTLLILNLLSQAQILFRFFTNWASQPYLVNSSQI